MTAIIGLTGGIATGKSTISNLLRQKGYAIVDADVAARSVVEPGEPAYDDIIKTFGKNIVQADGLINRSALGAIIFHNEEKRRLLNGIVHPAVRQRMQEWKEEAIIEGHNTIFFDIPLLFESKLTYLVEKVIVVYATEEIQLKRLMARNGLTEEDAKARIASQLPIDSKQEWADAVIDNTGSIEEAERQLMAILNRWKLKP